MKIRGSVVKVVASAAVVLLVCSFLLVAGFRNSRNIFHQNNSSKSPLTSAGTASAARVSNSTLLEAYGKLPLSFMENQGQTAREVRYVSHGAQYDLFLTSQEAVVALRHSRQFDLSPRHRSASLKAMRDMRKAANTTTTTAIRMRFEGADRDPRIAGAEKLPGKVNYFIGNDPRKWHTDIPTFARVKYTQLYPGVDLVFYGHQRQLEYDFVVAPGADPNVIRMQLAGANKLRLTPKGDVLVSVAGGEVELQKPSIYQTVDGKRREIAGGYSLHGDRISFAVSNYDRREPLIVDPILNYATYLGGTADAGTGFAIAVDANGDAFIAGQTVSTDFPPTSALSPGGNVVGTGFVTELKPDGSGLLYSTYLGGTAGGDAAVGIALASGDIYLTGLTFSNDFPTASTISPLKPVLNPNTKGTSFLTKLNPAMAGTASLIYSTYLGGDNGDVGNAVAADSTGKAYVVGLTLSAAGNTPATFPVTASALQSALPNSNGSAFFTVIDTTQQPASALVYSTYLGGDGANSATAGLDGDEAFGVVVDGTGKAYITGTTTSTDFPTSVASFQPSQNVANLWGEAFLSEINPALSGTLSLVYSTYLGGSGILNPSPPPNGFGDFANAIDLKPGTTIAYITGTTNSTDFPTSPGAFQTTGDSAAGAGFVTLLDTSQPQATALKYSTFLGSGFSSGNAIKVDSAGNAFIGGSTASTTFPVTSGAYQTALAQNAAADGFIAEINPGGHGTSDLIYGSYFGGSGSVNNGPDQIFGLAVGTSPMVFVTGVTFSTNLPSTTGAFHTSLTGTSDAFAASLNLAGPSLTLSATTLSFNSPAVGTATAAQTVTLTNNTNSAIAFTSATVTAGNPAAADVDFVPTTVCTSIPAFGSCSISVVYTPSVATMETATLTITDGVGVQTVALTGTVAAVPPDFTVSAPATLTVTKGKSGTATVTVGSVGGFTSAVTLACAGQPRKSTCSIAPSAISPAAGGSATATLTLTTTSLVAPPPPSLRFPPVSIRVVVPVFAALLMLLLFRSEQRFRTRIGLAGALLVFVALAGCASSSGTPKGTSTLTITGTSGALTHMATITLTVD